MNRLSIYLLSIGLILSLGGASYASDHSVKADTEQYVASLHSTPASIVQADAVINYTICQAVAELTDHGLRTGYSTIDHKEVPTPRTKKVKAIKLIRLILKHPTGTV